MDINQRLVLLISKISNSKKAFSEATGISTVILSHISSGRNKVSLSAVEQILKAFPNVNAEWLILGKGQLFKDPAKDADIQEIVQSLDELQRQLDRQKKSTDGNIKQLQDKIANLYR